MATRAETNGRLAEALSRIPGMPKFMIERAIDGYYHDFASPLAMPELQLVADLIDIAQRPATPRNSRPLIRNLINRVKTGDFDASPEESAEWANSEEGQETMASLPPELRDKLFGRPGE